MKALDFSFSRPPVTQLKNAGIAGVIRYVTGQGKAIDKPEFDSYVNASIPVALVFEQDTTSWRGGAGTGLAHGRLARQTASGIGFPKSRPIYAAYDTDIAPGSTDWVAAISYQTGFNTGAGGVQGAYAEAALLDELLNRGLIKWAWQTESRGFPGNSIDDPRACLIQRTWHTLAGVDAHQVDENDVFATDWGQHPAPQPATPPQPTTYPEVDVFLCKAANSNTVYVAPQGIPVAAADLNSWEAILVGMTGNPNAKTIWPVSQSFVDSITKH